MLTSFEQLEEYCEDQSNAAVVGFFSESLMLWMICQERADVPIGEAMMVWNATRECIVEAAESHHCLLVNGDRLQVDGV